MPFRMLIIQVLLRWFRHTSGLQREHYDIYLPKKKTLWYILSNIKIPFTRMICLFPLFGESWLLRFSVFLPGLPTMRKWSSRDINGSTKICSHFPIYSLILSIFIILPTESSSFIDLLKTMDEFSSERSKTWNIYTSSDLSPSQTVLIEREAPWKNFGSSMNAISFGFVATAVLISMFLIMAIFEHLFRPNPSFSSPQYGRGRSLERRPVEKRRHPQEVSLLLTNFEVSLYVELLN